MNNRDTQISNISLSQHGWKDVAAPRRQKVIFSAETKTHDGLKPEHEAFDELLFLFFSQCRSRNEDYENYRRHLPIVCVLLQSLIERSKADPEKSFHVLPCGGGRLTKVIFNVHQKWLHSFMKELLTHRAIVQ